MGWSVPSRREQLVLWYCQEILNNDAGIAYRTTRSKIIYLPVFAQVSAPLRRTDIINARYIIIWASIVMPCL